MVEAFHKSSVGGQGQQRQPAIQGMSDTQARGWIYQNKRVKVLSKGRMHVGMSFLRGNKASRCKNMPRTWFKGECVARLKPAHRICALRTAVAIIVQGAVQALI